MFIIGYEPRFKRSFSLIGNKSRSVSSRGTTSLYARFLFLISILICWIQNREHWGLQHISTRLANKIPKITKQNLSTNTQCLTPLLYREVISQCINTPPFCPFFCEAYNVVTLAAHWGCIILIVGSQHAGIEGAADARLNERCLWFGVEQHLSGGSIVTSMDPVTSFFSSLSTSLFCVTWIDMAHSEVIMLYRISRVHKLSKASSILCKNNC